MHKSGSLLVVFASVRLARFEALGEVDEEEPGCLSPTGFTVARALVEASSRGSLAGGVEANRSGAERLGSLFQFRE